MINNVTSFLKPLGISFATLGALALPIGLMESSRLDAYAVFAGATVILLAIRLLWLDHERKDDKRAEKHEKADEDRAYKLLSSLNHLIEDKIEKVEINLLKKIGDVREVAEEALAIAQNKPHVPKTGKDP